MAEPIIEVRTEDDKFFRIKYNTAIFDSGWMVRIDEEWLHFLLHKGEHDGIDPKKLTAPDSLKEFIGKAIVYSKSEEILDIDQDKQVKTGRIVEILVHLG
jgi:hypothetical protein